MLPDALRKVWSNAPTAALRARIPLT